MSGRLQGIELNLLRQSVDAMPAPAYLTDPEGRLLHCNRRAADYWGREPARGESARAFIRTLPRGAMQATAASERNAVRDDDGRPVAVIHCLADIGRTTDRQRADPPDRPPEPGAERRQSVNREKARADELSALMEAVPALVLVARDPDAREITGNRTAHQVLRVPPGANLAPGAGGGEPRRSSIRVDGRELPADELPVQRAARGARSETFEEQVEFGDGGRLILFGHTVPLYDGHGRVRGALAAAVDITEQKHAQQRLEELNEHLEQRVAARTSELRHRTTQLQHLANALSHAEQRERKKLARTLHDDLQQILVAIKTQLWSLQQADRPARTRIIGELNEHLDNAIESTRSLSRQLSPRVLHLGLGAALRWLGSRREMHGLELVVEAEPDADPVSEEVKLLLFQSVRELIVNAVKHAGVNQAWIAARRVDDDSICVTVTDQGAGFDAGRLDQTDVGDCVGLFGIRERLEALGGRLEVDSTPGSGTTIRLFAPAHEVDSAAAAEPNAIYAADEDGTPPADRPGRSVLLADRHAAAREGLARLLAATPDIEVVAEADSGREAMLLSQRYRPDVVVIDASAIDCGDAEALRGIREHCPGAAIIGLSMPDEATAARLLGAAGAHAWLPRDHSAADVIEAIRHTGDGRVPA